MLLCIVFASYLTTILPHILSLIVRLTLYRRELHSYVHTKRMDELLVKRGYLSSDAVHLIETVPADGWHIINDVLVVRSTTVQTFREAEPAVHYTLFALFKYQLSSVQNLLTDKTKVNVMQYESLLLYNTATHTVPRALPAPLPSKTQEYTISVMIDHYKKHRRCSIILSGAIRAGKSSTALFLAHTLFETTHTQPLVIMGFKFTSKGASLLQLLPPWMNSSSPYILLLNDIDETFEHASTPNAERTDASCLAQNKATLCDELDRLASLENLFVIMTTNKTLDHLTTKFPCFVCPGRVDLLIDEFKHSVVDL